MTDQPQDHGIDLNGGAASLPEVWTSQKVLQWSANWLKEKSMESSGQPKLDAELLLAHVLKLNRMQLYLQLDRPLSKWERDEFKTLLRRRVEGEPMAYILGYRDFYRHKFLVTKAVLIPRPDTEILVEQASLFGKRLESPKILDVGTGSGCVALSLGSELPQAEVVGLDLAMDAIEVAESNKKALKIENVRFEIQDALDHKAYAKFGVEPWDLIVSNPPYIPVCEKALMSRETLVYEPQQALFSGDDEGLKFYGFFAEHYKEMLKPHGRMFLEFGFSQASQIVRLFERFSWKNVTVIKDLSGHDRVMVANRP